MLADVAGRKVVAHLIPEDLPGDRAVRGVTELAFSPDGKRVAVAGDLPSRDKDWIAMPEYGCGTRARAPSRQRSSESGPKQWRTARMAEHC
ncbi:hypothetical protein OG216_00905 [Streptomycetaceae bacterium NBC_01309]